VGGAEAVVCAEPPQAAPQSPHLGQLAGAVAAVDAPEEAPCCGVYKPRAGADPNEEKEEGKAEVEPRGGAFAMEGVGSEAPSDGGTFASDRGAENKPPLRGPIRDNSEVPVVDGATRSRRGRASSSILSSSAVGGREEFTSVSGVMVEEKVRTPKKEGSGGRFASSEGEPASNCRSGVGPLANSCAKNSPASSSSSI
jgi:hypothetical protein